MFKVQFHLTENVAILNYHDKAVHSVKRNNWYLFLLSFINSTNIPSSFKPRGLYVFSQDSARGPRTEKINSDHALNRVFL